MAKKSKKFGTPTLVSPKLPKDGDARDSVNKHIREEAERKRYPKPEVEKNRRVSDK